MVHLMKAYGGTEGNESDRKWKRRDSKEGKGIQMKSLLVIFDQVYVLGFV